MISDNTGNTEGIIATRYFSIEDQMAFAEFSGDINPIHVDPVAARRTLDGQCIVHGMYSLLWALDELAAQSSVTVVSLSARFVRPIFIGEVVSCRWNLSSRKLIISANETLRATIDVQIGKSTRYDLSEVVIKSSRTKPNEPTFLKCSSLKRQPFYIYGAPALSVTMFPWFCKAYGLLVASEVGAVSQLVGMECPGLHSLFTSINLKLCRRRSNAEFNVVKSDDRIGLLRVAVSGRSINVELDAIYRPIPVKNSHISELSLLVKKNEFANVNALIIGGSRGLGEVVAKLISSGGGESTITYNVGRSEAEVIAEEILSWGGRCKIFQKSVGVSQATLENIADINQLYYFATPKIVGTLNIRESEKLYSKYKQFYVENFELLAEEVRGNGALQSVFYPSTVFVDNPPTGFESYVRAKAEGEQSCIKMAEHLRLKVLFPRLPRLGTDQNQSIIPTGHPDNAETMLPYIREMLAT